WGSYQWNDAEGKIPQTKFGVNVARLIVKGEFAENLSYHLMTDFWTHEGIRPILMQTWLQYNTGKYAQFRVGQFKYPFGIEAYPALIKWKFMNPSYVTGGIAKKLGKEGAFFRDIGAQVAGTAVISKDFALLYKAMIMNGNGSNVFENNNSKDLVGNVGLKLPYNIIVGGSYYTGISGDSVDVGENGFAVNVAVKNKKFTAQAEYMSASYELSATNTEKPAGFYVYGTYMILPKIEIGVRYDSFDRNTNSSSNVSMSRTTISTGYYFNSINRIMLNYEIRDDEKDIIKGNLLSVLFQAAI
ncbi:MAG: porin, partial [Bacteroidota bacterium]